MKNFLLIIVLLSSLLSSNCSGSFLSAGKSKADIKKELGIPSVIYRYHEDYEIWIYNDGRVIRYFYFDNEGKLIDKESKVRQTPKNFH